jgi:hypothetical protein
MKNTHPATKKIGASVLVTLALIVLSYLLLPKVQSVGAAPTKPRAKAEVASAKTADKRARAALGGLPLSFEMNRGQFDPQVQFASRGAGYKAFLTQSEAVFVLRRPQAKAATDKSAVDKTKGATKADPLAEMKRLREERAASRSVLRVALAGGNTSPRVKGTEELTGKINYFRGNDQSKWITDVPTFHRVEYANVYPGIDLVYYGQGSRLEYDFVVGPGADPSQIAFNFHGAERVEVDAGSGGLVVHAAGGAQLRQGKPVFYQQINGVKQPIAGSFSVSGNRAGFTVGAYDRSRPLIIDPVVFVYSTYLAGENDDRGHDVAADADGNAYVVGWTESLEFPTKDAYQPGNNNGFEEESEEAFITKFNPDGSELIWSTYLGGGSRVDMRGPAEGAYGVAVDSARNVYVTGFTFSADFPTRNAMQSNLSDACCDRSDSFITKLNAAGNQLIFSTYFGGADGSDVGRGIAVDGGNNVYVTGYTNSHAFPTTHPIQREIDGRTTHSAYTDNYYDAYLAKIDASGQFRGYSTYIGGEKNDVGLGVAVDADGAAYVTGWTDSTLPLGPAGTGGVVGTLYAANGASGNASNLYILDPATGEATQTVGPIGYAVTGLAFDPTSPGMLYGSTSNAGTSGNSLITIDPQTGIGTLVGPYGAGIYGMADIAFNAQGNLFGWAKNTADNTPDLYSIDKTTGTATLVGDSGFFSGQGGGLAFESSGTLYLSPGGASDVLYTVDPGTGQTSNGPTLNGAPFPGGKINAMKFGSDGLYGVNIGPAQETHLVRINVTNGDVIDIGPSVDRLDALAFQPVPNGEPTPTPSPTPRTLNFPATEGAFQVSPGGEGNTRDAFVTKVSPDGSEYLFSTFLGGGGEDVGWGIALGSDRSAFVTGYTDSGERLMAAGDETTQEPSTQEDFPTTPNAYQEENAGGYDAFLTRLTPNGSDLIYSTYIGGNRNEGEGDEECLSCGPRLDGGAVAVDFANRAYITGWTESTFVPFTDGIDEPPIPGNFPTKDAPLQGPGSGPGSNPGGRRGPEARDAFISKFNTTPEGADLAEQKENSLIYSILLGGSKQDEGQGIAVDFSANAYVTGWTDSSFCCDCGDCGEGATAVDEISPQSPENDFPTTPGAFQEDPNDGEDAFLAKIAGGGFGIVGQGQGFIISGLVSDGTTGIPGVTMTLTKPDDTTDTTTTDAQGIYFFAGLPPGAYTVTPSGGDFIYAPPSQQVIITNKNERADFIASPTPEPTPTPTLTTQVASSSITLGQATSDTATLSNASDPTGSITFSLFGPDNGACSGTPIFTSLQQVNGNGVYASTSYTPTAAGTYRWVAFYSGDENNSSISTACHDPNESVVVSPASTPTPTPTPSPTPSPTATPASQALNLSTRLHVLIEDQVGIGGFIITGNAPKRVIVRAIGPDLKRFGIPNPLPDPVLELHGPGTFPTIINDNWRDTQETEIKATGIPPTNDLESAIVITLAPGNYTGLIKGKDSATGIGLIEVYDLDEAAASKLSNISTRGFVGSTPGDSIIAGFILGHQDAPDRIVIRGLGPSLAAKGVPNTLQNPTLELHDGQGALLFTNNDWQDSPTNATEVAAAGLAPMDTREAAIAVTLQPGVYTAILAGLQNSTGNGLVEIYDRGAGP